MESIAVLLILVAVWIYILSVFKRKKLEFFYFMTGSIGMFMFLFFTLQPRLTPVLARLVCFLTGIVGNFSGIFEAYSSYGILFIENANGPISLYVDFECAGLIEMLVFISLIAFFSIYNWWQKIVVSIGGILWIMFSNIIRLFTICSIVHFFGNESYYIAHTTVGRLVFYGLSIWMYFRVFTKSQIKKQRVGEFDYASEIDK